MKKVLVMMTAVAMAFAVGCSKDDDDDVAITMVDVQGGTFTMGATAEQGKDTTLADDERPTHQVTVADFQIGKYEVTQKQWKDVMGKNPSYYSGKNNPVERVTYEEIQEFITKLNAKKGTNYRLPTEAEWEYAARGGNQAQATKYAGSNDVDEVAWYNANSNDRTHTVGKKKANELGIYDMTGNVWEFCSDYYGNYSGAAQVNPTGPATGNDHVIRGGDFSGDKEGCRLTNRSKHPERMTGDAKVGFRLAQSK